MGQRHGLIRAKTAIVVVRNINNKHRGCQPIETARPTIRSLRNINTFYCTFERHILVLAKKPIRVTYFPPERVQKLFSFRSYFVSLNTIVSLRNMIGSDLSHVCVVRQKNDGNRLIHTL